MDYKGACAYAGYLVICICDVVIKSSDGYYLYSSSKPCKRVSA